MRIFILEDSVDRIKEFKKNLIGNEVFVTDKVKEGIDILQTMGPFDYAFLDHDLDGLVYQESKNGTGYQLAEWISKNVDKAPVTIIVHSLNPAGAHNMCKVLEASNIHANYIPFAWSKIQVK